MVFDFNTNYPRPQISRNAAGYISPSPITAQCGNCAMFTDGSCDLVLGLIETFGICAYWEGEPNDRNVVSDDG